MPFSAKKNKKALSFSYDQQKKLKNALFALN